MPTSALDRLMFAQGGRCYFCKEVLHKAEASIEHLVASANGGNNHDDNCVACCKSINSLLGSMSLKEKIQVVLNQKGQFKCPNQAAVSKTAGTAPKLPASKIAATKSLGKYDRVIADLKRRGASRPRTLKTLTSTIHALFQKALTESELTALMSMLRQNGVVIESGTKISYHLTKD